MPSTRLAFTVSLALVVLLSGCGGTGPTTTTPGSTPLQATPVALDGEEVAATSATLCPDDRTTVRIVAANVTKLQVDGWVSLDTIDVDWENVTFDPPPSLVQQSLPPYYDWSTTHPHVTATVPVVATANATPGKYRTNVMVWHSPENTSTTTVTVHVRNASTCP